MINNSVVFILGAGASYTFGFPLGKELFDLIVSNTDSNFEELQE